MSDWEDDCDGKVVAVEKSKSFMKAPEWKSSFKDTGSEKVCFGVRNYNRTLGAPRGGRADGNEGGPEFQRWRARDGGDDRTFSRSGDRECDQGGRGGRGRGNDRADSGPPLTFSVENASIGRVIGNLGLPNNCLIS